MKENREIKGKSEIWLRYIAFFLVMFFLTLVVYFHQELEARLRFVLGFVWLIVPALFFFLFNFFAARKEIRAEKQKQTMVEQIESAKYEFMTVVTHKFRTPLSALKWLIGNMKREQTLIEKADTLKQAEVLTQRMEEMVDMLAGISKFDDRLSYAFKLVSFREILEKTLTKYSPIVKGKGIAFNIEAADDLPMVRIDESKIQFAIDMLLENAIKYTASNGTIDVILSSSDGGLRIAVKDSGIGLTKVELEHFSEKFFRGDEAKKFDTEGMGLGLSIARAIAENHNGRLWAESAGRGKGATFFMEIKPS